MLPAPALPGIAAKLPLIASPVHADTADGTDCAVVTRIVVTCTTVVVCVTVFVPPQPAAARPATARARSGQALIASEIPTGAAAPPRAMRRRRRAAAAPVRVS